ncbi:MAG: metallophosphoesterase [Candidatus Altiarchaeota archaeon]|nr:metallophosphoesterase [Candidatus Altiarchaeota archaeon]
MIGIISDTHDRLGAIRKAVDFLNEHNVSLVLHAGDYVAPFTVKEFGRLNSPLIGVYGNNDGERKGLMRSFAAMKTELKDFAEMENEGRKIALYHGTMGSYLSALISSGDYDVVVRGHTHSPEIKQEGKTLVINPGEVCGYLTGKKTLCLLDAAELKAEIHEL